LIILALAVVLAAGAFLSRPSEAAFKAFVQQKLQTTDAGLRDQVLDTLKVESYLREVSYKDHYLWTTIERGGKPVYTGAFSRWWGEDPALKK
jgi:hypothetical protein